MQHDFSIVFDTDNEYWQRVLDIFAANESYPKKIVSNRNLHHKFPKSFSKILGEPVDNDKDNLISLSLADHFLVHYYYYLLARKGYRRSMATAFRLMARKGLKYMTPETAEAMAKDYAEARAIAGFTGCHHKDNCRLFTDEYKQEARERNLGMNNTMYGRSGELHPNFGKDVSIETRAKISNAVRGCKHSEEARLRHSLAAKGNKAGQGLHWFTNGNDNVRARECPSGYHPGLTKH